MAPLIVLVSVTALLAAAGAAWWRPFRLWHVALRGGLAAMFTFTGVAHFDAFGMRSELVAMVPPALPAPELLVTVTGVLELAGAAGLLVPPTTLLASAGLSALLVAMFPANVYKALEDPTIQASQELVPRTLLQLVFLAATVAVFWHQLRARQQVKAPAEAKAQAPSAQVPG